MEKSLAIETVHHECVAAARRVTVVEQRVAVVQLGVEQIKPLVDSETAAVQPAAALVVPEIIDCCISKTACHSTRRCAITHFYRLSRVPNQVANSFLLGRRSIAAICGEHICPINHRTFWNGGRSDAFLRSVGKCVCIRQRRNVGNRLVGVVMMIKHLCNCSCHAARSRPTIRAIRLYVVRAAGIVRVALIPPRGQNFGNAMSHALGPAGENSFLYLLGRNLHVLFVQFLDFLCVLLQQAFHTFGQGICIKVALFYISQHALCAIVARDNYISIAGTSVEHVVGRSAGQRFSFSRCAVRSRSGEQEFSSGSQELLCHILSRLLSYGLSKSLKWQYC